MGSLLTVRSDDLVFDPRNSGRKTPSQYGWGVEQQTIQDRLNPMRNDIEAGQPTITAPKLLQLPIVVDSELHVACKGDDHNEAKKLQDHGADIEATDRSRYTPSQLAAVATTRQSGYLAARGGHVEAVRVLVEAGADMEIQSALMTPLHFAAGGGHSVVVEFLLKFRGMLETINHSGKTPLLIAASDGRHKIVQQLVKLGADREAQDTYSNTVIAPRSNQRTRPGRLDTARGWRG